jgi:hypothetical protein
MLFYYTSFPAELDTETTACVDALLYVHVFFCTISWPPDNIEVQGNHQKLIRDRGLLSPNPFGTYGKDKVAPVKTMKPHTESSSV